MRNTILHMFLFSTFVLDSLAQRPENYPSAEPEPMDINLPNIILYMVIPVLIIIAYIWTRRIAQKKRIREKSSNTED